PGPFNSPNDLAIASDGTVYFTDPVQGEVFAQADVGRQRQKEVVYVAKDGVAEAFLDGTQPPNGVLLSPDESTLYISITPDSKILKATIGADGKSDVVTDFATALGTPDGLTKDCLGNIYVAEHTAQHVSVFTPDGTRIATIKTGTANNQNANPTNVAFGGTDRKTLYIT